MKKLIKLSVLLLTFSFLIPHLALASWWNPFSWSIFSKTNTEKTETIKTTVLANIATTTTSNRATSTKIVTKSELKKKETNIQANTKAKTENRTITDINSNKAMTNKTSVVSIVKTIQAEQESQNNITGGANISGDNRTLAQIAQEKAEQEARELTEKQSTELAKKLADEQAMRDAENQARLQEQATPITVTSRITGDVMNGGEIEPGTLNKKIWSATFSIDSEKEVYLNSLNLRMIGSISRDVLRNIKLYVSGSEISSIASIDSNDELSFSIPPSTVINSKTLEVRADVIGGETRSFSITLQSSANIRLSPSDPNKTIYANSINFISSGQWKILGESVRSSAF